MFKRISIFSVLLSAFLMLQVHNMMPHQHLKKASRSHSHDGVQDHHHHEGGTEKSSPLNQTDHNAEFGKAHIKPGDAKYLFVQAKFIPLLRDFHSAEVFRFDYQTVSKISFHCRDPLVPPAPYLHGIGFRGPPTFV